MNSGPMNAVAEESEASESNAFEPVLVESDLMSSDMIDDSNDDLSDEVDFEDTKPSRSSSTSSSLKNTDSRRRLEDKLEELRLRRETREFDFDI